MKTELPVGWVTLCVGDIIQLNYGKALPASSRDNCEFPVYGSNGIVGYHSKPTIERPAIIVGRKGSAGEVHRSDGPSSSIDTTYYIDELWGQPLGYWYHFLRFRQLGELSRATALPGLNREDVYSLDANIPPLNEQVRIVAKIEALQERSRKAREALADVKPLLEQFRQSLLAAAFRGDLTADWRAQNPDVEPASELLTRIRQERRQKWEEAGISKFEAKRMKYSTEGQDRKSDSHYQVKLDELPLIPSSWLWVKFEEIIGELRNGLSPKPSENPPGIPILRINSVRPGTVDLDEIRYLNSVDDYRNTYILRDGDLLFTRYNGSIDLLGVCGMVRNLGHRQLLYPDKLMRVRFDHVCVIPEFIELYFASPGTRNRVTTKAKTTSGQQGVSGADIKSQPVVLPPVAEQQEIVRLLSGILTSVKRIADEVTKLASETGILDQSILAKAFRGELVSQDPTDEPASVLLDRIRKAREISATSKPGRKKTNGKRTAPAPDSTQLTMTAAQFVKDILILLGTWQKPVSIQLIEPALQLLHNELLRAKLLKHSLVAQKSATRTASPSQIHSKLPTVLGNLRSKGIVRAVGENHYQAADLSSVRISNAEKAKAQEAIRALEALIHAQGIAEDLVATFVSEAAGGRLHVVDAV